MYGDGTETIVAPELPDWCAEFDDGDPDEPGTLYFALVQSVRHVTHTCLLLA